MNAFLVQAALRGALILIAAFAAAAVLRRSSAAMRSLVWTAAFAALAALPAAMLTLPKWSPAPAVAAGVLAPGGRGGMASISSIPGAKIPAGAFLVAPDAAPRAGEFPWPLAVWALGCAAFAAWFLLGFWRASRMVRLAGPAAYAGGPAEEARAALGMRRAARIVQSSAAPISLAWGILRPAVILPSGARDWPEARLRAALLHELAHAQRFDLAAQAIAQAACCLYWFNPLVWLAARQLRRERERACDDVVIGCVSAPDYAGHLMELARGMTRRAGWAPAMAQRSGLETRVRALLERNRNRRPLTGRAASVAAAVACLVLLPFAAIGPRAQAAAPTPQAAPAPAQAPAAEPATAAKPAAQPARQSTVSSGDRQPGRNGSAGTVFGTVRDPSGAIVPNCEVTVRSLEAVPPVSQPAAVRTNAVGEYRFDSIPAGRYALQFLLPGFRTGNLVTTVVSGAEARANFDLALGEGAEQMTVPAPRTTPRAAASAEPERTRVGGNVQQFQIIRRVVPAYPDDLRQTGIEGTVRVRAIISKDGTVLNPQVMNADIDPRLVQAALDSVKQWRYKPTLLNGQPVETMTTIEVAFELRDSNK